MPVPNELHVRRVLETNDRDLKISAALYQAWADVEQRYPDRHWWRRRSTVRHVMWEHSVDRVMGVVGDDSGLAAVMHHDTASFVADDSVLFRLKKTDDKLLSSNYPTPLANLFHRPEADLFGHEGLQRVEIAHRLNRRQTGIEWIGVVARDGRKVIWSFGLRRDLGGEVIPLPIAPIQPAARTVVRPNIPDQADQSAEER